MKLLLLPRENACYNLDNAATMAESQWRAALHECCMSVAVINATWLRERETTVGRTFINLSRLDTNSVYLESHINARGQISLKSIQ